MEDRRKKPFFARLLSGIKKWFSVSRYQDGVRYVHRIKLVQVTIFTIFFFTSITNLLSDLPYSSTITLTGLLAMTGLHYLIFRHWNWKTRIAFFIFLNLVAFGLNYVEGTSSGAYFFYFLIMIIANFVSTNDKSAELVVVYIMTFLIMVGTFIFCPDISFLQKIDSAMQQINLFMNCFVSFLIGGIISYTMMKDDFRKEKALKGKQKFLDSVYNTSFDAVFIVDLNSGEVVDCNTQSLLLFEAQSREQLIGQPAYNFFAEMSVESSDLVKDFLANTAISWKGELTCISMQGATFPGYVSAVSIAYDGKLQKKINILDITDIKKARAELMAAKERAEQAFMARTKFLSNMSHELRTPLNGIIGTTNLLLQDEYLPEQKQYFNVLKYSSDHMLNLVNDILDFSKIEAGKMKLDRTTFNLKTLVDNICALIHQQFEAKKVELALDFDESLSINFFGDQTRLGQVISNLISNAHKFTNEGVVKVQVNEIARNSNACTIRIAVCDTGIGIPLDKQRSIFESFTQVDTATTRKFGGTGLGLAISSRIVELFGGKLSVDSTEGKGSCFHFSIQLGVDHAQSSYVNEELVREFSSLDGLRVLVAEDNPINMLIAKAILDKWDVNTTEAVNGREAVDKFEEGMYDVLLVDLEMPELDGYEVLEAIRMLDPQVPVIAFTAAVYENMQAHLINKGFNDYIQKPFRPEELHAKLARYKISRPVG